MIKKIIQRSVCLMLITTQAVWAAPMPGIAIVPIQEMPSSFFQIEIPEDLASVEEVYEAPAKQNPRVIMHIQNVHANYQAQVQVKKMLNYFYKNYGFKIIFCEGAAEKMDSKYLELFPEKKDNLALADEMAKKGQLTGPELYLMDAPEDVQAIGIEQTDLYRGNYEAFKTVYKSKKNTDSFMRLLDSRLELLSSRFLSRDMRRILTEWQKFHEGRREFMPFVKHLADESQKFLNLDLNSLFAQVEWPQTARLLVLQSMEADLKQDEAMDERDKLITFLKEHKASEVLISGLEKMEEKTISLQRLALGKGEDPFQPRKLLERLAEEAAPMGFQFHQYPNFSLYAGYTILESEMDSKVLFQEIEKLFDRILESLTVSEKEKNLLELYKDLELLKKLVALELTRPEWDQATYRKNWIKPQSLVDRLDKMSASGFVTEDLVVNKAIPPVFDAAFSFYDFARQREFAFYDTIEREMTAQKADRAVLVTGGFHTDGLSDIFRSKQINYGILTPRMGGDFDKANYIQTMMESHPTLFDLAQLEIMAAGMRSEVRFQMGGEVLDHMETIVSEFLTKVNAVARKPNGPIDAADIVGILNHSAEAFKRLSGPGAGFIRVTDFKDDTKNETLRFQLRLFNPKSGMLETVTNKDGVPRLFIVNPNFPKLGGGDAVILDIDKEGQSDQRYDPTKLAPPAVIVKSSRVESANTAVIATRVRVTAGGVPLTTSADGFVAPWAESSQIDLGISNTGISETDRNVRARAEAKESGAVDRLIDQGEIKEAIDTLASTIHDLASFQRFLDRRNKQSNVDGNKKTFAEKAAEMADKTQTPDLADQIPKEDGAAIARLYSHDNNPGAVAFWFDRPMDDPTQLNIIAREIHELLLGNPKQYLNLLTAKGTTPAQVTAMEDTFHEVIEAALQRFKILTPERMNSSEVIRMMISLMQRVRDLGRGSITELGALHFAQGNEKYGTRVPDEQRPYEAPSVDMPDKKDLPENMQPEEYAQLVVLAIRMSAAISRHKAEKPGEKISEELLRYLDDTKAAENVYQLNKNAIGLVMSMLKVWAAIDKSVSTSA